MDHNTDYVRLDEHGVLRVGAGRVMLDSVLAAWDQGHSPETIRAQYPSLTLEEVYGAIAWCLSHPDEVAEYLKRQNRTWEEWRQRSEGATDPLRRRLRNEKAPVQRQGKA
jgi:uncharacterized protein (DUF433 family)